ncbi:hypothetical protein OSB04_011593 [Centaurea solstitialis]|uniref:Integrase catalytic domain-containing protein n=1 Tax=Centaurea solstitialis TaxID=347529 RepID=A0AA38T9Q8_9ASTR|nr:hypothetical protein OSB04_011593 [Centaurea solstitialis]
MTSTQPDHNQSWLFDSGASHHITNDLNALSLHAPDDGTDELIIGDGSSLTITHVGSLILRFSNTSLILKNVLCVPSISKNIISISRLCIDNHILIELFSFNFLIKDFKTKYTLLRGTTSHGVYQLRLTTSASAFLARHNQSISWHHRLGHPHLQVLKHLSFIVPTITSTQNNCNSCCINIKNYFQTKIKQLFSDNGGEYTKLTSHLASCGISHITSPPHMPEHNGYAKRRHRYSSSQSAYHLLDPTTNKIYTSRHVQIIEHVYPYNSLTQSSISPSPGPYSWLHINIIPIQSFQPTSTNTQNNNLLHQNSPSTTTQPSYSTPNNPINISVPSLIIPPLAPDPTSSRPTRTIRKPNPKYHNNDFILYHSIVQPFSEPQNITQALKQPHWCKAMQEEYC